MKKILAAVLVAVLLTVGCIVPTFAYGSEATTLGELLSEYDYTDSALSFEISTSFHQNVNSSYYDIRSDNAEAQLEGTYYPVSDISAVIEILRENSDSEFEDVYYRDENGDVSVVEQSEDYYSWGSEKILIRTTDGALPRLIIFLDTSGDSCLFCWETGKGCKLSDGAYERIKEALGIDNLAEEDALTYSYYPLPDEVDEYTVEEVEDESDETDIATETVTETETEAESNPTTGAFLAFSASAVSLGVAIVSKKRR